MKYLVAKPLNVNDTITLDSYFSFFSFNSQFYPIGLLENHVRTKSHRALAGQQKCILVLNHFLSSYFSIVNKDEQQIHIFRQK